MKKIIWIIVLLAGWAGTAMSAEISIPAASVKSGQTMEIPVKLDATDNLAGIKLAIKYDAELLSFRQADKSKETSGLMHIVNDKKPGILIIVMASAKGIAAKDFRLVTLTFEAKKGLKEAKNTKIEITESQLMSDQLKDIAHTIKAEAISISPDQSPRQ